MIQWGDTIAFGGGFLVIWLVLSLFARNYLRRIPKIGNKFEGRTGILLSILATPLILALLFATIFIVFTAVNFVLHPNENLLHI